MKLLLDYVTVCLDNAELACSDIEDEMQAHLHGLAWLSRINCPLLFAIGGTANAIAKLNRVLARKNSDQNSLYSVDELDFLEAMLSKEKR